MAAEEMRIMIKNLNETNDLDRMDEMDNKTDYNLRYPTLSDAMALINSLEARLDSQYGLIQLLTRRVADLENKPQYEKTMGV